MSVTPTRMVFRSIWSVLSVWREFVVIEETCFRIRVNGCSFSVLNETDEIDRIDQIDRSVQRTDQTSQRFLGQGVIGIEGQGFLVGVDGLGPLALLFVDSSQVEMGEGRTLIASGLQGFLKPDNRLVQFTLFDQIGSDI